MYNPKKQKKEIREGHLSFEGGVVFKSKDALTRLKMVGASAFMGEDLYYMVENKIQRQKIQLSLDQNRYYPSSIPPVWQSLSPTELMEKAIDEALDQNAEETLKYAVELRNLWNIRLTPQVILVRATHHAYVRGTNLIQRYQEILQRTDDAINGLAYQIVRFGKRPIPNSLKKVWRKFLESQNEYQIAKYRMEKREVNIYDLVNLVHPKGEIFDKLMKGQLKLEDEDTWEAMLSAEGKKGQEADKKSAWLKIIPKMGHMALLRNIRNFLKEGVDPKIFMSQLIAGVEKGKQLPFRYFSAWKSLPNAPGYILDGIEKCMRLTLENLPKFPGKMAVLADNSGSMNVLLSKYSSVRLFEIANILAVLAGLRADEAEMVLFASLYETRQIQQYKSIFDQARFPLSNIGGGTEPGIWLKDILNQKKFYDYIFLLSDMQVFGPNRWGDGKILWELLTEYRKQVNPNVLVFSVNLAAYGDSAFPEWYDKVYLLGGWSERILDFAYYMAKLEEGEFNKREEDNEKERV